MGDTRATLRTRARALADQDSADFPTDSQYNQWLDDAKRDVWHDLLTAGWPVNYATQTISADGSAQYPLALGEPVTSVRAVYLVSGGTRKLLERLDESTKDSQLSASTNAQSARYEILVDDTAGTVVRLYPLVSGTIEVEYIAEPAGFANDAEAWYGPAGSDSLICLLTAAAGCRKEGRRGDAADLMQEYGNQLAKVVQRAAWVDQRNTPKIRDVYSAARRDPFDYPTGSGDL